MRDRRASSTFAFAPWAQGPQHNHARSKSNANPLPPPPAPPPRHARGSTAAPRRTHPRMHRHAHARATRLGKVGACYGLTGVGEDAGHTKDAGGGRLAKTSAVPPPPPPATASMDAAQHRECLRWSRFATTWLARVSHACYTFYASFCALHVPYCTRRSTCCALTCCTRRVGCGVLHDARRSAAHRHEQKTGPSGWPATEGQ